MCNPFAIAAAAVSVMQTTQANSQARSLNRANQERFDRVGVLARADANAAIGDAESRLLQENEAEAQEMERLTQDAAAAAGSFAALKGGQASGATLQMLLSDAPKKLASLRAVSRRNTVLRKGAYGRFAGNQAALAQSKQEAAFVPPTPTTDLLPMLMSAGAAGMGAYASTGGNKWADNLGVGGGSGVDKAFGSGQAALTSGTPSLIGTGGGAVTPGPPSFSFDPVVAANPDLGPIF